MLASILPEVDLSARAVALVEQRLEALAALDAETATAVGLYVLRYGGFQRTRPPPRCAGRQSEGAAGMAHRKCVR